MIEAEKEDNMSILRKAIILCTPKAKADPVAELSRLVAQMDEYQARLVLSFVKSLFGAGLTPGGQTADASNQSEEGWDDLAA